MTFDVKIIEQGQLPLGKGTLYTVPAGKQAIIRLIVCVNTDAATRWVNLYAKKVAGTSRRLIGISTPILTGAQFIYNAVVTLDTGEIIEGDAEVAAFVDYNLFGVEITL